MESFLLINQWMQSDLYLYQCGRSENTCGFSNGPSVWDHYLIHYVLEGKGTFKFGERTYTLVKGQAFVISPDILCYYEADNEDPWTYAWIAFSGLKADMLIDRLYVRRDPVFSFQLPAVAECFDRIMACQSLTYGREIRALGYLYILLSQLMEAHAAKPDLSDSSGRSQDYIKQTIRYIEMNYNKKITVQEIADYIGLDRSHLFTLFKGMMNISIQTYLIQYRMNKACELMSNRTIAISDIARSVGYEDPLLFSRMFRKAMDLSPREYRRHKIYSSTEG